MEKNCKTAKVCFFKVSVKTYIHYLEGVNNDLKWSKNTFKPIGKSTKKIYQSNKWLLK